MSNFIDRDKLLKDVSKIGGNPWSEWETAGVFDVIRKQPVVDAVPVVRCGECCKPIEDCPFKDHVMLKTDFCSYGERRASGE